MANEHDVRDSRIHFTPRHYLTLSGVIAILLWVIAATAFLLDRFEIAPLKKELTKTEQTVTELLSRSQALETELAHTQQAYHKVLEGTNAPILISPADGATVIGEQIIFKWDYTEHSPYQKYILELRAVSGPDSTHQTFNVLNPETRTMYFPTVRLQAGEYLWRIIPGHRLNDRELIQGAKSNYSGFYLYSAVIDRIRTTREIRIGTSPTLSGRFNFYNEQGKLDGFDIDLINWLTEQLAKQLGIEKIQIRFLDLPWNALLPRLQNNELDAVISSMTSTLPREKAHRGIRFSNGYFQTHQIFITLKPEGKFPAALHNKRVGVSKSTTNEEAAFYLAKEFAFEVDNSYTSYSALYNALERQVIDYALVDDVLVNNQLGRHFHQFGKPLTPYLTDFYRKSFGRDSEMFGIAVREEPHLDQNLLSIFNSALTSPKGQQKLSELRIKWANG